MSDDAAYVRHMLDAIERIEAYTDGVSGHEFTDVPMIQDAVIRQLAVPGEAAPRTPAETQRRHDDIPWRDVTGMHDTLNHGYFGVDVDIVWETVVEDVPGREFRSAPPTQRMRRS